VQTKNIKSLHKTLIVWELVNEPRKPAEQGRLELVVRIAPAAMHQNWSRCYSVLYSFFFIEHWSRKKKNVFFLFVWFCALQT
jgi:hypothetical protein